MTLTPYLSALVSATETANDQLIEAMPTIDLCAACGRAVTPGQRWCSDACWRFTEEGPVGEIGESEFERDDD